MALYDRLVGYDPGFAPLTGLKIAVHQFVAGLAEGARGAVTRAQIITAFGIQPAEEADLDALIAKAVALPSGRRHEFRTAMHDWLLLAEGRIAYTTQAQFNARFGGFS